MSDDEGDGDAGDEYSPQEAGMSSRRDVRIYRAFGTGKRRRGAVRNPPGQIDEGLELPEDIKQTKPGMPKVGTISGPLRDKPTAMKTMTSLPPRWRRNAILVGCAAVIVATLGPALKLSGLEVPLAILLAAAVIPVWIRGKRQYQRRCEMDDVIEDLRPYLGMERANRTAVRIRYWYSSMMPGTGRGTPRRIIIYHWGKLRVNTDKFAPICAAAFERQGWGHFVLIKYDSFMNRLIFAPAVLDEGDGDYMSATEAGPINAEPLFDGDGVLAPGAGRTAWRPPSQGARMAAEQAESMADQAGVWSGAPGSGSAGSQPPAQPERTRTERPDFGSYTPPQYNFDSPPPRPAQPRRRPRDTLLSDGGLLGDSLIGGDTTGEESAADAAQRRAEAAALFNRLGRTSTGRPEQQSRPGQPRLRLVQEDRNE